MIQICRLSRSRVAIMLGFACTRLVQLNSLSLAVENECWVMSRGHAGLMLSLSPLEMLVKIPFRRLQVEGAWEFPLPGSLRSQGCNIGP